MKRFTFISLALLILVPLLAFCAWAKPKTPARKHVKPKVTALICSYRERGFSGSGVETESSMVVIGGLVAGKGWISSEQAKGLLHKGDKLPLHVPITGAPLGTVVLTGSEGALGYGINPPYFVAHATIPSRKRDTYRKADKEGLAVWSQLGHAPRWVTGKVLNVNSKYYRKVITNWLRTRETSDLAVKYMVVEQIIQADINRDGRMEAFLSFHSSFETNRVPRDQAFSCLIMQYNSGTRGKTKTVAIADENSDLVMFLIGGFCDLDRDGWAEVVIRWWGGEGNGSDLLHWTGDRFKLLRGWELNV